MAAGPSHGSMTALQYRNMSRCASGMVASCPVLAGISSAFAIGASRPARTSSSNTLSSDAVSDPPAWTTGFTSSMKPSSGPAASRVSCDFIQLTLPWTVLISPLCASMRNGCARRQVGKVLVEYRWW